MNILNFLGLQQVLNNLNFIVRHSKARRRKDISQILYQLRVEFIFLYFSIKTSLVETLEYFLNIPVVKITESRLSFFLFSFSFLFLFDLFFIFRTLGLEMEVIGHTVTSVTSDGVVTILITELKRRK